jgi:cell division protein FtsX
MFKLNNSRLRSFISVIGFSIFIFLFFIFFSMNVNSLIRNKNSGSLATSSMQIRIHSEKL